MHLFVFGVQFEQKPFLAAAGYAQFWLADTIHDVAKTPPPTPEQFCSFEKLIIKVLHLWINAWILSPVP